MNEQNKEIEIYTCLPLLTIKSRFPGKDDERVNRCQTHVCHDDIQLYIRNSR